MPDFDGNEAKKSKKNQNGRLKKTEIFKNHQFSIFFAKILEIGPYGWSHNNALRINLSYKPKDLKFWQKNIENWRQFSNFEVSVLRA